MLFASPPASSPADGPAGNFNPDMHGDPVHPMYYSPYAWYFHEPIMLLGGAFWLWMLIHCLRNDSDRQTWLWILIVLNIPGAIAYFFVRWLPQGRVPGMASVWSRMSRRRMLPRLEAAARNIGNPHQHVELGDALRELGNHDRAVQCYRKALSRDGDYLPALWGAAQSEMQLKQYTSARETLEKILKADRTYKFGDASMAYGRTLYALADRPAARVHLEQHLKGWTQPEAYVLFADLLAHAGETDRAREYLETMLIDLSAAPTYYQRQNKSWRRKAKSALSKLPSA